MAQHLPFSRTDIELTQRDIQFECGHCGNILIVDKDGEGIELACPHCGGVVTVPPFDAKPDEAGASASASGGGAAEDAGRPAPTFDFSTLTPDELAERFDSVEHKLKENASQRMELQGNINRTTIEMHRQTLKMERLQKKQTDLEAERAALTKAKAGS